MASVETAQQPLSGRSLGEFVVREQLGEGGAGVVYRAEQPLLSRDVVIKALHARHQADPDIVGRFTREARLACRLEHPYAAHVYAFGAEPDGLLWIAMELVRGTPLDRLLAERGPLPLERFVPFFDRICEVVAAAHEQGVVHRDLKPANIMVLARGGRLFPKLLDFGIAKGLGGDDGGQILTDTDPSVGSADTQQTRHGIGLGSPPYMAPEQWRDAGEVDLRADIYALGVIAYESLTGRRPFHAPTLRALARAHRREPVPPLGDELPATLDPVIAKAMAKDRDQRYATALDLAAATRSAAGMADERELMPRLDEELAEEVIARFPQPLAEVTAELVAARSAYEALARLHELSGAAIRYTAAVALAASVHIGAGPGDMEALDHLRQLRTGSLQDAGWLALARALCRPLAGRADAHPLPELVELFFDGTTPRHDELAVLAELQSAPGTPRAVLALALPAAARMLRRLRFFADSPLVVAREGAAESWMGLRRRQRRAVELNEAALSALAGGHPALVDPTGRPLVVLHPVVQAARPAPESPPELFLLDRNDRHGAVLRSFPIGFEHHDATLWSWLGGHVLLGDDDAAEPDDERCPYPGLSAFSDADAAVFVGREAETEIALNRLRVQPLLAVVGPSGAGKSSLVHAGVVPSLPEDWTVVRVRPGGAPLAALRAAAGELEIELPEQAAGMAERLREHRKGAPGVLVIVVDQLEELFTLCEDRGEREQFAAALAGAARTGSDPVRVVVTLRDDFLARAEELAPLRQRISQSVQFVTTPGADDLVRILVEPARRVGYTFEDEDLPGRMVAEVSDQPGALPMLAFAASRLWELRDRQFRTLPRRAYESLGGVAGALAQHAEATLEALPVDDRRLVREAFRHLVTSKGTRAVLTRRELEELLGGVARATAVIEALVASRLVVVSEGAGGVDQVEIAHEALLSAWPRLRDWQREDAEGARLRDQLRAAARQWDERGRGRGLLWRGEALTELELWMRRASRALTGLESAFVAASRREAARGRRLVRAAAVTAFALVAAIAVVLYWTNQRTIAQRRRADVLRARAEANANEARQRLVQSYREQGRELLLSGEPMRAAMFLQGARHLGADDPELRFLLAQALVPLKAQRLTLGGHHGRMWSARYSPDGTKIVTGSDDGTAQVWNANTGALIAVLRGHHDAVYKAVFSLDGRRVLTASGDGTARLWSVTGKSLAVLHHNGVVFDAAFSPDGNRIATASWDETARIWDRSGKLLLTFKHPAALMAVAFDPSGKRLATACADGVGRVFRVADGHLLATLRPPKQPSTGGATPKRVTMLKIRFVSGGNRLLTAGVNAPARLWDAATGALLHTYGGHQGNNRNAAVMSPDGSLVATSAPRQTVDIWRANTGKRVAILRGHTGSVSSLAFSPDGSRLASAGVDGVARVWDTATGTLVAALSGHGADIYDIQFSPDGHQVLTAGWDGTARTWDPTASRLVAVHQADGGPIVRVQFDDGTGTLATVAGDGVRLWDANSGRLQRSIRPGGEVRDAALAGNRLVVAHGDATLFDAGTGKVVWSRPAGGDPIVTAGITADGARVALGTRSGRVLLLAARDGASLGEANPGLGAIAAVRFSRDGGLISVRGDSAREAAVLDGRTAATVSRLRGHQAKIFDLRFGPFGRRLVTTSPDRTARIWDAHTGRQLAVIHQDAELPSAEFNGDGSRVVTGCADAVVRIADARTGAILAPLKGHRAFITTVDFGGALVASGSADQTARVWGASSFELLADYPEMGAPVTQVVFGRHHTRLAVAGENGRLTLWDVSAPARAVGDTAAFLRCRVPFRLKNGRLVQAKPDAAARCRP